MDKLLFEFHKGSFRIARDATEDEMLNALMCGGVTSKEMLVSILNAALNFILCDEAMREYFLEMMRKELPNSQKIAEAVLKTASHINEDKQGDRYFDKKQMDNVVNLKFNNKFQS